MSKITIVGAPFSTFSRTIRMAFHHLNIEYNFEHTMPHTKMAYKYNPFGRIPSILVGDKAIFESSAIRDYIDSTYENDLTPKDLETRLKVDQMISVLCDYIFHHVVFGVAKPREQYESENKPEDEIAKLLQEGLKKAGRILSAVDTMVVGEPFLCGDKLTWADYFVYPAMADLYSLPEGKYLAERAPKLYQWYQMFEKREEANVTYKDTVADTRSKKSSL